MSEVPLHGPADEVAEGNARRRAREQLPDNGQLLYINVQWYPGELVFEAHRLLYH